MMRTYRFVLCPYCSERTILSEINFIQGSVHEPVKGENISCVNCRRRFKIETIEWGAVEDGSAIGLAMGTGRL